MHPYINQALAAQRTADFMRTAEAGRKARAARKAAHAARPLNRARPDVADEHASPVDWGTADSDFESAREVWRKFSPRAQAVFSLLIDNAGLAVTGEDIASKLDIPNGKRGVAGIVAWPARHCADAGYVPLFRCEDADGGYWMDPDAADLFARVRDAARPRRRPAS